MDRNAYKAAVRGTAIFGGVQVFNILINLVRGKFIAMFLGPQGMGVYALLLSSINTIRQVASLGLNMSAVRDIARADEKEDLGALSRTVVIFRRLVSVTSLAGALVTIITAPQLSRIAFGHTDFAAAFAILSVMVLFTLRSDGDTALLQGTKQFRYLARSSITGSLAGLVTGVPLFYFFGVHGIAPAMALSGVVLFTVNRYYARKTKLEKVRVPLTETLRQGKQMISMGMAVMSSTLIGTLCIYLVNIFIGHLGNIEDIGVFQAASSITNQYAGVVISAMAVDFFPRLATICDVGPRMRATVNQQAEIVILLIVPIVMIITILAPVIVRMLLTVEFISAVPIVRWMSLGVFFKAISFPMGYIAFAKGDRKTFFLLEGIYGNLLILAAKMTGYLFFGLTGLGAAFAAAHIIYFISLLVVTRRLYGFRFNRIFGRLLLFSLISTAAVFLLAMFTGGSAAYVAGGALTLVSCLYSCRELDRRTGIREFIRSKMGKR